MFYRKFNNVPQLICITGMDGTGKSTLCNALSTTLHSVAVAGIWDALNNNSPAPLFRSRQDIDNYLCHLNADARALFLSHAIQFSVNHALLLKKEIVLLNGYIYKYFAMELALGASADLVQKLISSFPVPQKTIYLELPVEQVVERKQKFSRYECGLASNPSKENFILFQQKVAEVWRSKDKSDWYTLNAALTPDELLVKTNEIIS